MAVSGMAVMATARARGHKPSEPSVGHHGGVTQPSVENKTNHFNTQPSKTSKQKTKDLKTQPMELLMKFEVPRGGVYAPALFGAGAYAPAPFWSWIICSSSVYAPAPFWSWSICSSSVLELEHTTLQPKP